MDICENSNYIPKIVKRHKCKKRIKKIITIFIVIFLFLFSFIFFILRSVNPIVFYFGKSEINKMLTKACNTAICKTNCEIDFNDLIEINCDKNGNISYIKANSNQINIISNKLALNAEEEINKNSTLGINIPIGTLSGIGLLSGKGKNINFSVNPTGSVICNFYTTFVSSGINQTSHKIFVKMQTSCYLIMPFKCEEITIESEFLLTECLIVGNIPNTYLNIK